jgi:serine/threonine-protein kinase SRK2
VAKPEQVMLLAIFLMLQKKKHCILTSHLVQRITIPEIKNHPWFLKNLPIEMTDEYQTNMQMIDLNSPSQSVEEIMAIIQEARKPGDGLKLTGQIPGLGSMDLDDVDVDDIDVDDSGDFVCAL